MNAAPRPLIDQLPYDCKIQSISDLKDGRAHATLIRRDNTSVGVALCVSDLEYWQARIASILDKVKGDD